MIINTIDDQTSTSGDIRVFIRFVVIPLEILLFD